MVYVKGGTFTMGATAEQGSDVNDIEKPTHSVTLSDFYIGKYEVTQAQWKAIMGTTPSYFKGDNLPVEQVSWNDIQEFIQKLNAQTGKKFRLPTEAEWEYAARGGNKSKGYKYSGSNNIDEVAWYYDNSSNTTHPVGQKTPNELGIYDMSGNVWEWCQDWYGDYSSEAQTNPTGPSSGSNRVLRGGSWFNGARSCRVSYRYGGTPDRRSYDLGFRLVLETEGSESPDPEPTPDFDTLFGEQSVVYVKGGTFTMGATAEQGSDALDREKPTHSVTLSDYYIGKYEVTQAQWVAIMGTNPSTFIGDNNPVDNVSWDDIQEFITKLNEKTGKMFRLPTEAEWEYAARGGNQSKGYKYSGSNNIDEVAWYTDNSSSKTYPVGQKSPNELGIYDMSGNVWEWCQDWYGSYSSSSQTNPTGPSSGSGRVVRGGSWSLGAERCRVSNRDHGSPDGRYGNHGFRLALEAEGSGMPEPEPEPEPTPDNCKIGDILTINGVKGVVFQTTPSVKLVSVTETTAKWSTEEVVTGATDTDNGRNNMSVIKAFTNWQTKYPAFAYCVDMGEGWYLPANNELKAIYAQKDTINATLSAIGMDRLGTNDTYSCLWSSSEQDNMYACGVDFHYGDNGYLYYPKVDTYVVRGIVELDADGNPIAVPEPSVDLNVLFGDDTMVFVAGGTFTMGGTDEQGSDVDDNEKPTHSVTLSEYYIGKYEVTQAQWIAVMGSNPSNFTGDNNPVERVSWNDVQEFITKLNAQTGKKFRLPTEAEWEYAARGGNQSKGYKYSGSNSISDIAWYGDNSSSTTHPVGQKTPNELGIYDMSGNVYEWCQDGYGSYSSSSQTNPTGPSSGSSRVLRGGSWNHIARYCRVSFRNYITPGSRNSHYGFRLVLEVEGSDTPTPEPEPEPEPTPDNCKIGDILTINGVNGVVFQTTPSVKMVSITETTAQWSTVLVTTGATDKDNGRKNMSVIKAIADWQSKYPAFNYCANIGEGWYIPALNELKAIYDQKDTINATLSANNMEILGSIDGLLWSSCECSYGSSYCLDFAYGGQVTGDKSSINTVRAIVELDADGNPIAVPEPEPEPGPNVELNVAGFDMVYVKGGTFTMGATAEQGDDALDREKPAHPVTVADFYIGKYEVTQAQWRAVMGSNPSNFTGDNNPVERVSWDDIQEFITKLNAQTGKRFRLPTEAEWEYAARGGSQSKGYKYSGSDNIDEVAWCYDSSSNTTHPVGQKTPNELGIYDMTGNVCEWCQDWYGSYSSSSQTNPTGPSSGSYRVLRGGSWYINARYCRVSNRFNYTPDSRFIDGGFRLVMDK